MARRSTRTTAQLTRTGGDEEEDELTKMGKEEDVFPLDPGKSLFLFD